jgi:hypothetical protein
LVPLAPDEQFADGLNIKLKSATYQGRPPVMIAYNSSLAGELIDQPEYRLIVDASDRVQLEPAIPHPAGTGFLSEALNEYLTMTEAHDRHVPTHYPIGVGQFLDLAFGGEEVGFVVILINNQGADRIGYEIYRLLEHATSKNLPNPVQWAKTREAFEKLRWDSCAAARTLKLLHENGQTHSHPSLANYDPVAEKQAQLCDFTNARSYRVMSRGEFIVRVFNDIRHLYRATYAMADQRNIPLPGVKALIRTLHISAPVAEPFCATTGKAVYDAGYFGIADIRRLGWKKIQQAMKLDSFIGFLDNYWQEESLPGLSFSSLTHPAARLIADHAGAIYDRLRAAE